MLGEIVFSLSFSVSVFVPDEINSAFGVFRECFGFVRFALVRSEYISTRHPVELNGPKKYIKNDTNDTKTSAVTKFATRKQGPDYSEARMETRGNQAGRGPDVLSIVYETDLTGPSLTAD